MREDEAEPAQKIGAWIERNRHVIEIAGADLGLLEAIANRLGRKPGPVLDTVEAFFLNGGDQLAIDHDRCRSVAVVGIDAKNVSHGDLSQFSQGGRDSAECRWPKYKDSSGFAQRFQRFSQNWDWRLTQAYPP